MQKDTFLQEALISSYTPVRMVRQNLHWLTDVSYVPELRQAVISAAC